jgi:hypothetical protein
MVAFVNVMDISRTEDSARLRALPAVCSTPLRRCVCEAESGEGEVAVEVAEVVVEEGRKVVQAGTDSEVEAGVAAEALASSSANRSIRGRKKEERDEDRYKTQILNSMYYREIKDSIEHCKHCEHCEHWESLGAAAVCAWWCGRVVVCLVEGGRYVPASSSAHHKCPQSWTV